MGTLVCVDPRLASPLRLRLRREGRLFFLRRHYGDGVSEVSEVGGGDRGFRVFTIGFRNGDDGPPRPCFSPSAPTRQRSRQRSIGARSPLQPSSQLSSAPLWWPSIDNNRKQGIAQLRDGMWRRRSRLRCGRSLDRSWWWQDADLILFVEARNSVIYTVHIN
jgi:hypothetical protein